MNHLAHYGHHWAALFVLAISTFTAVAMGVWVALRRHKTDTDA